jgi:predicted anti-sigma-YlaC factor YlaD
MTDVWTDRLSEYLDGELLADDRRRLEEHLESCAACRATLTELELVVAQARRLEDRPPVTDLWSGVVRSAERRARRVSISWVELVAASLFIAFISGVTVWFVSGRPRLEPSRSASVSGSAPAAVPVSVGEATYDRAVSDLLRALDEGRNQLSPKTIEVMERSLTTVDRAIAEARAALDQDPGNVFLTLHLARERQRKLALLRQVQTLSERPQ